MADAMAIKTEKKQLRRDANYVGYMLIAMLLGQLAVAVLLIIVMVVVMVGGMVTGSLTEADLQLSVEELLQQWLSPIGYQFFNMLQYVLSIAVPTVLVALAAALFTRRTTSPFPTRRAPRGIYPIAVFGGMAVSAVANVAANYVMSFFSLFGVSEPQMPDAYDPSVINLLLNIVATAVLPALIEEMVMRGFVLGALRPHGDKMAIIITAVLFGLIHGNVLQLPFAFILGIMLGWLTVQTGSIWPAVVLHFTNNATSVLLSWLEQFTDQGGAITTILFLACCVIGTAAFLAAFLRRGRLSEDLLKPIGNGTACLSVKQRFGTMLTAPAFLIGVILWVLMLLLMTALL